MKKDLTMLLAFLLSGWPPSLLMAAWMIRTMSSLNSSWERNDEHKWHTIKLMNIGGKDIISTICVNFPLHSTGLTRESRCGYTSQIKI